MDAAITYVSIEDLFWIDFKDHLISLGHKDLPEDIHFTISFDKRSTDINFHLTRNVSDRSNKPKITIASINKDLANKIVEPLGYALLELMLIPLDIRFWRGKYGKDLYYCSITNFGNNKDKATFEEYMIRTFKENSKVKRKSRLKIKSSLEEKFINAATKGKLRNLLFRNIKRFPRKVIGESEGGFLITPKTSFAVIQINETWYKLNDQLNPLDLCKLTLNDETISDIIKKFQESLEIIKTAETYRDTEAYDIPINLVELHS